MTDNLTIQILSVSEIARSTHRCESFEITGDN